MRKLTASGVLAALSLTFLAACGDTSSSADVTAATTAAAVTAESTVTSETSSTTAPTETTTSTNASETNDTTTATEATTGMPQGGPANGGGGPGGVNVADVTTEEQLIALIQDAYGDGGLDLHRGHQPVQDVLDAVLTISHEELHVRMGNGQNLAAVAEDLGVDPDTLIDAMVESWSPAIDQLLAAGTITDDEASGYLEALRDAFTFRVTWNGEDTMPTFTGLV